MSEKSALALPPSASGPRAESRALATLGGSTLTREQVELVKRTVARGVTDDELSLFVHVAQKSGLDPFAKQIYAIKRRAKVDGQWREVMTIQTGIDGFRVVAARTSQHAGTDDAVFEDGDGHPKRATVTVWKIVGGQRVAFTATARWEEYVQTYEDRETNRKSPMGLWGKMPYTMLAKCAEALALRKAFPMDLSGIYAREEIAQADEGEDLPEPPRVVEVAAAEPATKPVEPERAGAPAPVVVTPDAPPAPVDPVADKREALARFVRGTAGEAAEVKRVSTALGIPMSGRRWSDLSADEVERLHRHTIGGVALPKPATSTAPATARATEGMTPDDVRAFDQRLDDIGL